MSNMKDDMRVGIGYDIHKLVEGRKLILGGVEIPYTKGLLGHSDADVLIHSICDAILGALALGDIGTHFPDTDEKYKDISSIELLKIVMIKAKENGYGIVNVDTNIIIEKPKVASYINKMIENIKAVVGKDVPVSIKARTNEGLDSIGEEKAIVAQAIVLLKAVE